ncbi:MAG: biotin--[Elusimicrobiaceae bacterium]|nr:biotin--[acetyl-CoA-carboxylase] ligase [Elusimicrobiaceae bacterium]
MQEIDLALGTVNQLVSVEVLDSTQNLARELAEQGAQDRTLVLAYEQTHGRGQYERAWNAKRGGVYFTLLLRPQKEVCHTGTLSVRAAQAVCETLQKMFGFKTKIKHPNDVLVWEANTKKWKKICGILIESSTQAHRTQWLLVGVGINVNNPLTPALKDTATSVKKMLGREIDPEWVLQEVLEAFFAQYAQWQLSSQI